MSLVATARIRADRTTDEDHHMADRAKTPPPAKKAPAKAPRRSLWMIGGIGALVAIVVAGGLIYLSQRSGNDASGGGSDAAQVAAGKLKGVDEVAKRFKGIPQDGAILGDPNATVTITEFADLRCPACQKFELDYFPAIVEKLIRTGKAKYEFQLWPILGTDSVLAAEAGIAAREQDMLYQYSDLWYINQQDESTDYATDAYVDGVAKALGLDLPAFQKARQDEALWSPAIQDVQVIAAQRSFGGTPSFIITGPKGEKVLSGAIPTTETITKAVKEVS